MQDDREDLIFSTEDESYVRAKKEEDSGEPETRKKRISGLQICFAGDRPGRVESRW
jgi:hypothetical protein